MSEERKVVCRYCGGDMELEVATSDRCDDDYGRECQGHYVCKCGACTPDAQHYEACIEEEAYLAATATPPNPPMTREQVEVMPDLAAVWRVFDDGEGMTLMTVKTAKDIPISAFRHGMYFAAPPTSADIAAARKDRREAKT